MELIINDRIRNRKIDFFNSFQISLKYNAVASSFAFDFYFDPDNDQHKDLLAPHYHIAKLYHEGVLLLTGYILAQAFTDSPIKHLVPISGYSLPGILEDCQVPTNEAIDMALASGNLKLSKPAPAKPYCYPIQDDGLSLRQIATKYLAPFGIQMVVDPAVEKLMDDDKFEESTTKPKDTIKHYLTELATQKNINITHDELGRIVFTKANTNLKPLYHFNVPKGGLPGVKMDFNFDGQAIHSHITVMKQADLEDDNGGQFTIENPYVPFIFRPKTVIQSSGTNVDTELAAKNALAEELRHLRFTISLDRWDINEKLIRPNNLISVTNPEIYLYKKTNLFIESVDLTGNQKEQTSILHCVLPEVYNGQVPNYIYKGINLR